MVELDSAQSESDKSSKSRLIHAPEGSPYIHLGFTATRYHTVYLTGKNVSICQAMTTSEIQDLRSCET
jgi:hypothetical protein